MRLPNMYLTTTVAVKTLEGTGPRGAVYSDPVKRRAHVEERTALVIDQRTTSDTAGTEITSSVLVIVQPEHHAEPGSFVQTKTDGRWLQVANAALLEHPHAPSHSELRCV